MEKRNAVLDIVKGICIILMVIGHSGCPDYLNGFIYMFHMPCFFFISGYLLNDKYLTDLKTGLQKRVKGSYWPFVKWSLIFLLFHNLFAFLHIYANSYSLREFGMKFIRILTMTGSEQLLGGYWFLISLCWAGCGGLLFFYILNRMDKLTYLDISGGVILTLLIACLENYLPIKIPAQFGEKTFMAIAFYLSGYLLKKVQYTWRKPFLKGGLLLVVPAIAAIFMRFGMGNLFNWQIPIYYIIAMSGSMGILGISQGIRDSQIAPIMASIGSQTLYILTFHFLAFKIVSYIYIQINGLPMACLASFPTLENTNSWMWMTYSVVGVSVPLLLVNLKTKICLKNGRYCKRK